MAFSRDHGRCCLVLPLKFGIGIIAMYEFVSSLVCIMALLTGDIRFQATGYNPQFYHLYTGVGAFGLVFAFVGLLGVYDDKPDWIRHYNLFLIAKQIALFVSICADVHVLRRCEGWTKHHTAEENPHMFLLSQQGVCPWAQWAYFLGCTVDFLFNLYFVYLSLHYQKMILMYPSYKVDFANERHDVTARWQRFHVKNPYTEFETAQHDTHLQAHAAAAAAGKPLNELNHHTTDVAQADVARLLKDQPQAAAPHGLFESGWQNLFREKADRDTLAAHDREQLLGHGVHVQGLPSGQYGALYG